MSSELAHGGEAVGDVALDAAGWWCDPEGLPLWRLEPGFVAEPEALAAWVGTLRWESQMMARGTASFGVPYNYSIMVYAEAPWPPLLGALRERLEAQVGAAFNNCLVNHYASGARTMGAHTDMSAQLVPDAPIAILSVGGPRVLLVGHRNKRRRQHALLLESGSLLLMSYAMQQEWKHGVPPQPGAGPRTSLTFRCLLGGGESEPA